MIERFRCRVPRPRRITTVVLVTTAALTLAACGGGDGDTGASSVIDPGPRPELAAASASPLLPVVTVRDVTNDEWVQFADLVPADKPVLVWFWAPH